MNNSPSQSDLRQSLLNQLASITTMQRGSLAEEFRERPSPDGNGTLRRGPYFKYQCWEDGHNFSRRVPADQVASLREDLANAERFDQITNELARLTIKHTRDLRAQEASCPDAEQAAAKKNSKPNAKPSVMRKPKPSSLKPVTESATKGLKG
jgi:hypothetical protein